MGQSGKDPGEKHEASAKALGELMDLFLRLNSKLREKIGPRPKEERRKAEKTEMVIIILNSSLENPPRPPRQEKPKLSKPNWIDELCKDIEGEGGKEKSS